MAAAMAEGGGRHLSGIARRQRSKQLLYLWVVLFGVLLSGTVLTTNLPFREQRGELAGRS